jgi:hypothetical protein
MKPATNTQRGCDRANHLAWTNFASGEIGDVALCSDAHRQDRVPPPAPSRARG